MGRVFGKRVEDPRSYPNQPRDHFDSNNFISFSEGILNKRKRGRQDPETNLPKYVSSLCLLQDKVKILDFGGRMGEMYYILKDALSHLPVEEKVEYHVLELPSMVARARELNEDVSFFTSLEEVEDEYDVVYLRSSLQYIFDWEEVLRVLSEKEPVYILFDWTPMTISLETFAVEQITQEGRIPYLIHNYMSLIEYFKELGYYVEEFNAFFDTPLPDAESLPSGEEGGWYYRMLSMRRNDG